MNLMPAGWHPSITVDRVLDLVRRDDNLGLCILCGQEAMGVEPDARRYSCESCNRRGVYGAEELLVMLVP